MTEHKSFQGVKGERRFSMGKIWNFTYSQGNAKVVQIPYRKASQWVHPECLNVTACYSDSHIIQGMFLQIPR